MMNNDADLKELTDHDLLRRMADLKLGKTRDCAGRRGQEEAFARVWYNRELNLANAELRRRGISLHAGDGWRFPGVSGAKEVS